jgi:DNA transposition AAA+ family ATPase
MSDPLIDRQRIRGASRMIAEGTEAQNVTPEQIAQVAADVETARRNWKISVKDIARAIGYSAPTLSEFLNGKYAGRSGQVAIDLENWLVEEEQRRSRPQTTQFVLTEVAKQIRSVAVYCLDFRKIGLVYGPDTSGIGKTTSLQAIAQDLGPRRASLVTMEKVDANPTGLLRKVCQAMHIDDNGSNAQRFNRIADHLKGRSHILLIDQIHNLRDAKDDKPFFLLTDLYDRTETAQLWCGTADLVMYLEREQARTANESLAQIRRRIFPCVDLMASVREGGGGEPLVTVEQIREMFAKNQLRLTDSAARFLCKLANIPDCGSIGLCVQIVEYATVNKAGARNLEVADLRDAMSRGLTGDRARVVMNRMDEAPARIAKVG